MGAYFDRGMAYFKKEDYDHAITDWEAVLQFHPYYTDTNYRAAKQWLEDARWKKGR